MSEISTRLHLPYIQPAQAQKHVTHNEAIERLDSIVQLCLEDVDVSTPPPSPTEGQSWGISPTPTDAWIGRSNTVATWQNNGWLFIQPADGWQAWVVSQSQMQILKNGIWSPAQSLENINGVGINTASDASNPLSVVGPATLLSHDGNSHQLKINKAISTDSATLLFQRNFTGHAEVGLAGDDSYSIKVSADGSTWSTAMAIDADSITIEKPFRYTPSSEPMTPAAGEIYFDQTTNTLRCFDGTVWQDLF